MRSPMFTEAVILAGGRGTRLEALTRHAPKPLLEVCGHPFLVHLVRDIRRHGIDRIIFSVGYLAECIMDHFGDGSRFGARFVYSREDTPLDTGGAARMAAERTTGPFLVFNADSLFLINYLDLGLGLREGTDCALALRRVPDATRFGTVTLSEEGRIERFLEKQGAGPGLINAGVYALRQQALRDCPQGPSSLERDLFPRLAAQGRLAGREYDGYFIDIGLPCSLEAARANLDPQRRRGAVFLHQELLLLPGAPEEPPRFRPGAAQGIKYANDSGALVVMVGDGRLAGPETPPSPAALLRQGLAPAGAHIDAVLADPLFHSGRPVDKPGGGVRQAALEAFLRTAAPELGLASERSVLAAPDRNLVAGFAEGPLRFVAFHGGALPAQMEAALRSPAAGAHPAFESGPKDRS